jgi:hypothetical protein
MEGEMDNQATACMQNARSAMARRVSAGWRVRAAAVFCAVAFLGSGELKAAPAAPAIPVPPGYGHYCSLTYPGDGWAFAWSDASKDVCAELLKSSPGGTIMRAGLYSMLRPNNVVYRCGAGVGLAKGNGQAILQKAFEDSKGKKGCVFTVAPKSLPIFGAPFAPAPKIFLVNGFDFARGYKVKSIQRTMATDLNYMGHTAKYLDDHDASISPCR